MSWLCVQKESAYCNCKQFGREMKKKEEEGSASVRLGIYGSCWRDAAVWVHQECVLCKNCSHAEVCSLTTANKLPREHWLRFFFFSYCYSKFTDHLRIAVAALRTRRFCRSETILPGRFSQIVSSFPNRWHNTDTTGSDWPELLLPSLKSTGSDQYLNPPVFFLSFFLFLLLLERFHFFPPRIWEPVCNQSGFWSSSISNKWERPRRDYVNAWWQQPGCDAGRGGEGRERGAHCRVRAPVR